MNLKEAFRFQNALKSMLVNCDEILGTDSNVTKVQSTHLRKKVMSEAEDETVVEQAESEYADRINDVLGFMMYLLDQRAVLACPSVRSSVLGAVESGQSLKADSGGAEREENVNRNKHLLNTCLGGVSLVKPQ